MTALKVTAGEILNMAGKKYEAALIDMDGTILDSLTMWQDIDWEFLTKRGLPVEPDYLEALKTRTFPEAADYTIARYHLTDSPDAVMAEWNQMAAEAYEAKVTLMPGAEEFLRGLKQRGIRTALCSVSQKHMVDVAMISHGLTGYFDLLADASCSDKGKSDPGLYHYACGKLGKTPAHCLVVEDSLQAMKTAAAAGYTVLALVGEERTDLEEIKETVDYYMTSF